MQRPKKGESVTGLVCQWCGRPVRAGRATIRSVDYARRVALARVLGYAPTLGWEQLIDGVKDRLEAAERRRAQAEVIHVNARRQIAALTRRAEDAEAALERVRALHGVTVDSLLTGGTEEAGR